MVQTLLSDSTASVRKVRPCLSQVPSHSSPPTQAPPTQAQPGRAAVQSHRSCQGKAAAMGKAPMKPNQVPWPGNKRHQGRWLDILRSRRVTCTFLRLSLSHGFLLSHNQFVSLGRQGHGESWVLVCRRAAVRHAAKVRAGPHAQQPGTGKLRPRPSSQATAELTMWKRHGWEEREAPRNASLTESNWSTAHSKDSFS